MLFASKKVTFKKIFNTLNNKYQKLTNSNIEAKLTKLKGISENNEEYLEVYNTLNEKYIGLVNTYSLTMDIKFNKADNLIATKDYKSSKEQLNEIENDLKSYEKELDDISEEIKSITKKEEEIRETVIPLKEDFRNLKANFYEHKEELSVCSKSFENKITEVEKTIAELENKLENWYYKDAEQLINEIQREINFYKKHLEKMPQLVSFSMQVLPKRLESAMNKYQKMKDEGYPLFSIKATSIEEKVRDSLDTIRVRFEEYNYDDINDSIKETAYEIESLNEALEKEVTAKDHFSKYVDIVYTKVDEIGKKFLKAKRDTNSIKGYYLFDNNRYIQLSNLEEQVHILNRIKMELDAYIHSATKQPYTVLSSKMGELAEFGGEVEDSLVDYQNYILSLKNDSESAYRKVNEYSIDINTLYHKLVALNHKVLSNEYKEEYEEIREIIIEMSEKLQTKPIDVLNINLCCKDLTNKAEILIKKMNESLNMYKMAQNIIVFTNKYRSSFSTVNEVLNRAQIHFDNGEFEFAIDSVSEVLQEVHPKAYEEMMKAKGNKDD